MLERSFLDALRSDPNDELSRLAYADWLDDAGDPRAELLRLEMELFRPGAPPALRLRVNRLAARADPGWLCAATLMARRVEMAWSPLRPTFTPLDSGESAATLAETANDLVALFDGLEPPRGADFLLPYEYSIFSALAPGGWFREGARGYECALWAAPIVLERTAFWYEDGGIITPRGPATLWLSVGVPWSDHEEYFLCCDRSSHHFGEVINVFDDFHPVQVGTAAARERHASHVQYLRSLAR